MAASARLVVLLAVMAVLAGCGSSGFNKAGDSQQRRPVVLTLANSNGNSGELDGFANNIGATPVWLAVGGPATGFGAIEQHISSIQSNQYDRAGKYLTANVNLWPRPLVLFATGKIWASLTPAQRRILSLAVTDDLAAETNVVRGDERTDTATLCRRGRLRFVDATPAGLAALRRAVQPVYAQLERDPQTRRYIRQIQALRQGIPAEPAPGCAPATRPTGTGGTLDGVYRFTDTVAELRAAPGTTPGDMMPENYGAWTLVLDRGHFAITQEDQPACTWGYGTFTIKGNRIQWLFTNGGGIAPNNAYNKPGEDFIYGWSLYRGVLTLSPVKDAISPSNFRVKPWARISTTPSARFLSKRCPPPAGALPR